jgi:hypothetical protein
VGVAIAEAGDRLGVPSRSLAAAAQIANASTQRGQRPGRDWARRLAAIHHTGSGPIEHLLRDLDISDADLLARAADIDRASERLILDASERAEPRHSPHPWTDLTTNASTAAIANQALGTGFRAAALLLAPSTPAHERAEPEL